MEQTNLNIGTIGQKLESARQAKGVTVSEAGHATKILSKFIEAMEADDFGALSAPVYAKSFIRMYATYLGLDAAPLVDEYVQQHAPRTQRHLSDEVRQNLANVDQVSGEAPPQANGGERRIFGDVNQAIARLSGNRFSTKTLAIAGGSLLALIIILASVTQCASDDEDAPVSAASAGGAASVTERQLLYDEPPDAYLVKPGEIETGK
jgi:hypothetical protein